jgi:hypothetical protein
VQYVLHSRSGFAAEGVDQAGLGRCELVLGRCLVRTGSLPAARDHLRAACAALDGSAAVGIEQRARAHELLAEAERRMK